MNSPTVRRVERKYRNHYYRQRAAVLRYANAVTLSCPRLLNADVAERALAAVEL
jgi:hypothetical protein